MKVAIDIRRVRDFGVGTYTRNLVNTLAGLDLKTSYTLVGTTSDRDELERLPENFSLLEFDRSQRGPAHDLRLGWALRRHRIELYHSPYLTTPWGLPCRRVVTVHDTADFLDMLSDGTSLPEVLRFQRTRRSLHRAARVLTVSHATRRELQQIFSLPQDKIEVVYNALDARLEKIPSRVESERVLTRYSAHDPYLLYAGNVRPHKNLPRLIEAYALVKDELRDHPRYAHLKLIIIGEDVSRHPQLRRAVIKSRTQHDVRFLGFVDPQTLNVFYAGAAAFVFPSLHEGFGLPPLEAMAQGTPVVSSSAPALLEVLGEAALFVNAEKVFDLSRGIRQVLLEEKLRQRLVKRGHQQVRRFSWKDSVRRILDIYHETAGG